MKDRKRRKKVQKIVRITLFILCGLFVIAGSSLYLLFHSYIGKVNLVPSQGQKQQSKVEAQTKEDVSASKEKTGSGYADRNTTEISENKEHDITVGKILNEAEQSYESNASNTPVNATQNTNVYENKSDNVIPKEAENVAEEKLTDSKTNNKISNNAENGDIGNENIRNENIGNKSRVNEYSGNKDSENQSIQNENIGKENDDYANTKNKNIKNENIKNISNKNVVNKINEELSEAGSKEAKIIRSLESEISKNIENTEEVSKNNKVKNILIFGSYNKKESNIQMNSMVLLSINENTQKITATNFYENIYLMIPGKGYDQLKTAFAYNDGQILVDTLEANFKISVDHYVQLDYDSLTNIIDSIGGINVEIQTEELSEINTSIKKLNKLEGCKSDADLIIDSGKNILNGKQVLAYSRCFFPTSDSRVGINRQIEILNMICKEFSNKDITKLNELLNLVLPQITTNFTEGEILLQLLAVPSILKCDIMQLSIPIKNSYTTLRVKDGKLLGIDFEKNIKELKQKLYS
jgi:anionic cell wall polymer biosynthesis LytR-Cps2A-Psr (LCP) family protein